MIRSLVFSLTFLVSASSLAGTGCPQFFAAGRPPVVSNAKLQSRTQELCFRAYAVLHSGLTRTPLYAAEYLTRKNIKNAAKLSRKDSFHAEQTLPASERSELEDYERSGYDRGHMAPNADFSTRKAQVESFSLANMVPQVHENNAGVWAGIENSARQLATSDGDVYVLSGPAFIGDRLKKAGNVLVPTHLWKVIYSPSQNKAGAYLITNDDTSDYAVISVSRLEKMVGISLLPGLPQKVRDAGLALPKPMTYQGRKNKGKAPEEFTLRDLTTLLLEALKRAARL